MATVDVLVPTYNRSVMLRQCLESIQAPTYRDIRVIIGDNCSDDDTRTVAQGVLTVSTYPSGGLILGDKPTNYAQLNEEHMGRLRDLLRMDVSVDTLPLMHQLFVDSATGVGGSSGPKREA